MKQDRIDRLIEITGQIPESYVAEALPQSLRETLSSDVLTEAPKEKRTMKTSIAHYIAGGFAAAAAIGVLVGGGLLISTLNKKPERPADSGTDTTAVITVTTENTVTTTTTVDGSVDTVIIGNFEFATYADHAKLVGYDRDADSGMIEIPAEADSVPVTVIGEGVFSGCGNLIAVDVPLKVNSVGSKAFADCPKLEAVTFFNDDVRIEDDAFAGCDTKKLTLRGGAGIEAYARAHGFDYEPLDGTQSHSDADNLDADKLTFNDPPYYHFVDGKPEAYETGSYGPDPECISDGTDYFRTKNNGLYRRDNDRLVMTLENPQQYFTSEGAKGKEAQVMYTNIVAVGDKWYFVCANVGYEDDTDNNSFTLEKELLCWVNRQTGKAEVCSGPMDDVYDVMAGTDGYDPRNYGHADHTEKYEIGTMLWQADPDGDAVFATDFTEQLVIRMPAPGAGEYKAWYVNHSAATVTTRFFTPSGNGKVMVITNTNNTNQSNSNLYELNTADGRMIPLSSETVPFGASGILNIHGRIFGVAGDKLVEYAPVTGNPVRTIAELNNKASMVIADYSADALILTAMWEIVHEEEQPDLLVSLKDGKVTELK